jgi:hypothetical protein
MKKNYTILGVMAVASSIAISAAFAQTSTTSTSTSNRLPKTKDTYQMEREMRMHQFITGRITAINNNTITITMSGYHGMNGMKNVSSSTSATTSFTINAANATITKDNATTSIGSFSVGDTIFVEGAISGNNIIATMIYDEMTLKNGHLNKWKSDELMAQLQGNGQPVIAGNVTAINGNILTVTNRSNVTYNVDATNSRIITSTGSSTLGTSTISSIQAGDLVIVQGQVNGNTIMASTVLDYGMENATSSSQNNQWNGKNSPRGMMKAIGNFFSRLFGF